MILASSYAPTREYADAITGFWRVLRLFALECHDRINGLVTDYRRAWPARWLSLIRRSSPERLRDYYNESLVMRGLLCLLFLVGAPAPLYAYDINEWWSNTQTDGGGNSRGDALTLLWSVVPDGEASRGVGNSDVIDALDDGWAVDQADRTPDLTNRPWWSIMDRVYEQYERVSGLTMTYVHEQDAQGNDTGQFGDMRIAGTPFFWENDTGGVLADNSFPSSGGDMRIDTYRDTNGLPSWWIRNEAPLRNLIAHESGHGVGLSHEDAISGANAAMETPLETSFWGLQFDDIYAFNRMYGDPLEKNGGNDTAATATFLGAFANQGSAVLGLDANDAVAQEMDDDWVGIDGSSDTDWFRFTASQHTWARIELVPQGPTYDSEQGANTNYAARSDVKFSIYAADGQTKVMTVDLAEAGAMERLDRISLPYTGDYYVRVEGESNLQQFYSLDVLVDDAAYQPPQDENVIFVDTFDINGNDNADINFNRFWFARQKHSVADSLLKPESSTAGDTEILGNQLRLSTTSDGDAIADTANVQLLRNFLPQLDGEHWKLSFDLSLTADAGASDQFTLTFDDNESLLSTGGSFAKLGLTFNSGGSVVLTSQGQLIGSSIADTSNLLVEVIVDETGATPTMDVVLGGSTLLSDLTLNYGALGRYFSLLLTSAAGVSAGVGAQALVDNLMIELVTAELLQGDFNGDGIVDGGDYALWRNTLGQTGAGLAADGNNDGAVNSLDLDLWLANYGATSAPGAAQATAPVPEPLSLTLALLLTPALAGHRRRQGTLLPQSMSSTRKT